MITYNSVISNAAAWHIITQFTLLNSRRLTSRKNASMLRPGAISGVQNRNFLDIHYFLPERIWWFKP